MMMRFPGDINLGLTTYNRFRPFSLINTYNGLDWYYTAAGASGATVPCNLSGDGLMTRTATFTAFSNDSNWHVWCVTWDVITNADYTIKLWKDGTHVGNYTTAVGTFCSSSDVFKYFAVGESSWSHAMIWSRILSDAEILNLNDL